MSALLVGLFHLRNCGAGLYMPLSLPYITMRVEEDNFSPLWVKTLQSLEKNQFVEKKMGKLSPYSVLSNKYIFIESWIMA